MGSEGYAKAEVTLGGVATNSLSSKTMESKSVPGLYVIGEAVDVTGWLGGYNFQWAWSSGWVAGNAVESGRKFQMNVDASPKNRIHAAMLIVPSRLSAITGECTCSIIGGEPYIPSINAAHSGV